MSTPKPKGPDASPGLLARIGRALTLLVTNVIKLGGLWVAVHEIATQAQPRLSVMAVALFMMTGAQVSEEAVFALAGRMFGAHSSHEKSPKP